MKIGFDPVQQKVWMRGDTDALIEYLYPGMIAFSASDCYRCEGVPAYQSARKRFLQGKRVLEWVEIDPIIRGDCYP